MDIPGKLLKEVIAARPAFIKPNLTEYQEMAGKKVKSINDVLKLARSLSHLVPLQCISSVEGGALLVTPEHAWYGTIPKLKVQSTVGAGDSMVGAMAQVFVKGGTKITPSLCEKMLRTGLAASAATLSNKGLTMGTKASIRAFVPKIKITQLD